MLSFYADASLNKNFSFSGQFLEMFALTAGILTWGKFLKNFRMIVFSDNEAVVNIVNNMTSRCLKCIKLVRLLVLDNFVNNKNFCLPHKIKFEYFS